MSMEHYRPRLGRFLKAGYYQGGYCPNCGWAGMSMYGNSLHGQGICKPNKELVATLHEVNSVEAENKREFTRKLKGQPSWTK